MDARPHFLGVQERPRHMATEVRYLERLGFTEFFFLRRYGDNPAGMDKNERGLRMNASDKTVGILRMQVKVLHVLSIMGIRQKFSRICT
jgi:hypothetical protein